MNTKQADLRKGTKCTTRSTLKTFIESRISSGTSRKKMLHCRAVEIFLCCDYGSLECTSDSTVNGVISQAFELLADLGPGIMDTVLGKHYLGSKFPANQT